MKNILIISKSPLDRDPRVYKQILFLRETGRFRITTAGTQPSSIEDNFYLMPTQTAVSLWKNLSLNLSRKVAAVEKKLHKFTYLRSAIQLKLGRYEDHYWSEYMIKKTYQSLSDSGLTFDLIIANDVPVLPLALKIAERCEAKVYLDAHEYEPLHYNHFRFNFFYRDYWHSICKRYLPKVDFMTTVCDGIADEYSKNFGVRCDVLMNLPFLEELGPTNRNDGKIRMVHHGIAAKQRRIENMIQLMKHLDSRFHLDFMMIGTDTRYGQYLRRISRQDDRIRFLPTVNMSDIVKTISSYDLGLFLLPANTFNHRMVLPNKIFEFIQARLAVAIWPSQEMVKIVEKYDNGVYPKEFDVKKMAIILNKLTRDDIARMKHNSHLAAFELNSEKTREQLIHIVDSLLAAK